MNANIHIENVWNEHKVQIKAFLHSRVSNPDDVDDLLQEILIKMNANIASLKSGKSLKSWLYQISKNAVIDYYRKNGKERSLEMEELWYEEQSPKIQEELSRCVEPFIRALPQDIAQLLIEIDLNEKSQKQLSNQLGISYSTLKSRVQKGRKQLLGLFEECCRFSFDRNGAIIDFDPKSSDCKNC